VLLALLAASLPVLISASGRAEAHWLSRLVRVAGETAGEAAGGAAGGAARMVGKSLDDLANVSRYLKAVHPQAKGLALAAHATPEGHWKFVNREGEVFTAASPEEMARVVRTLAPDAVAAEGKLTLYLSEDTVFGRPQTLKDLPAGAQLKLQVGAAAYPLRRAADGALVAAVRPNILLRLEDRALFDETQWQLARPLRQANLRTIALDPEGAQTLSSAPRLDAQSKAVLVDRIDPWKLPSALPALRGQTAILTGRVEGELLYFATASGERSIILDDVRKAAAASDVNLVVLQSKQPVQPGGRNWLWQKVEVTGLREALNRATFGDFLDALGAGRGELVVAASPGTLGRTRIEIVPTGAAANPVSSVFGEWTDEIVSQVAGNVVSEAIKVDLVSEERQKELDRRIVPGIPFIYQAIYIAGIVMGLIGLGVTRSLWRWIWPPEERSEYAGGIGYAAARFVRGLLFVLLFLPIVGIPAGAYAIIAGLMAQLWWLLSVPFRVIGWVTSRFSSARG